MMKMKDIELIDFETIGRDFNDQVWVVYPKEGNHFFITVVVNGDKAEIITDIELDDEIQKSVKKEALLIANQEVMEWKMED